MSDPKPSLAKAIQSQFAPALRRDGFSGSGQRYRRVIGEQCQIIEVQGSRSGGKFAVNMGIQPLSVLLLTDEVPDPKRIREMDCIFRRRLAAQGADQWWAYQPNQQSMDSAASDACSVYLQAGRDQLQSMAQSDSPLNTLTPEAFVDGTFNFKGFGNTGILMAWTLAQMRRAAGNSADARGFALAALKEIGERQTGSALRPRLREFLESV